ncbi:MAG: pimeloyl-ACP methyl ester esterase BioH [Methylophaga sp.]
MFIEITGRGPDLVLLHGWSMNRRVWQLLKPYLENDFTLHCVDLPGHGDSDWQTGAFDSDKLIPSLAQQLPQSAIWLGWSLAGQFALQFANAYPERVQQLIMLAATPKFVADDNWQTAMPVETFKAFSESLEQDPAQLMQSFLTLMARGAQFARDTIQILQEDVIQGHAAHPNALREGLNCLERFDGRQMLADLAMPVNVLLGERDNLIPAELAAELKILKPDINCQVVQGAGHAPFISHPAQSAALIKNMIHD